MYATEYAKNVSKDVRKIEQSKGIKALNKFGVYAMIVVFIIIGIFVSDKFLSVDNILSIIGAVSLLGIVSLGVSFITYSGHYCDMSVPATMAFSGIIAVQLLPHGIFASIIGALASGILVGVINGLMVGKLKANPIIWTLAMQFVMAGLLRWFYSGNQIYPDVIAGNNMQAVEAFYSLSRTYIFGRVPLIVVVMIAIALICQFILSKTQYGRQLKLVGSSLKAAKFSGVNTSKVICIAFVIASLLGAVGGVFLSSFSKVGAYYMGEGYDFNTVTAVVLGGMTLFGGRGNMAGVVGGVITIGLISNIMTFIGMNTFSQYFVKGLIFVLIVWLNSYSLRKLGRDYV